MGNDVVFSVTKEDVKDMLSWLAMVVSVTLIFGLGVLIGFDLDKNDADCYWDEEVAIYYDKSDEWECVHRDWVANEFTPQHLLQWDERFK